MFKKTLTGLLTLGFGLALIAAPISSGDLAKVNAYLAAEIGNQPGAALRMVSGDIGADGLLSQVKLVGKLIRFQVQRASLGLQAQAKLLELKGSLLTTVQVNLLDDMAALQEYVDNINKKGLYSVTLSSKTSPDGSAAAILSLVPASPQAESIERLTLRLRYSASTTQSSADIAATLKPEGTNVAKVRKALTNIFENLKNQKDPDDADMTALDEVYGEIFRSLED